jgi:hypothetical protein
MIKEHRMMKKEKSAAIKSLAILAALVAVLGLVGCATEPKTLGPRLSIELTPGETYKTTTGWFIFTIPIYPQVAAWVETLEGEYLGTIYVTGKAEKKKWVAAPAAGRPEALPVWSSLAKENLDAVSAATSAGKTLRSSDLAARLPAGEYAIMLETNRSYDYNSTYTEASSGVNGQPSIVYRALIQVGKGPASANFQPIGRGQADGSDGSIQKDLRGIDTALTLFSAMRVEYQE